MLGKKQIFQIEGMTCQHCVMRVEKAIAALPQVKKVKVDLKKASAEVKGEVSADSVKEAVQAAGYKVV
ncbi:MAG: copper ion binding protein [Candidatus Cloacimonadales bacterium]